MSSSPICSSPFRRQTYELDNGGCCDELDLIISQLKSELFEKQQNVKDFCSLQARFRDLLNNFYILCQDKLNIEYLLKLLGNDGFQRITDLRTENENLLV